MPCRKGIADEELAGKEAERLRKRKADKSEFSGDARKRSRSASSYSSTSASTISTNRSRSAQRQRFHIADVGSPPPKKRSFSLSRRRARSPSSSADSYTLRSSNERSKKGRHRKNGSLHGQKSTSQHRHQERSLSKDGTRKRRRDSSSLSRSYSSDYSTRRQSKNFYDGDIRDENRNTRRRRSSVSPDTRGRDRSLPPKGGKRRTMSRSDSVDRSRVARARHSLTPQGSLQERANGRDQLSRSKLTNPANHQHREGNDGNTRYGGPEEIVKEPQRAPPLRKERSLSPFSKRLALTQAMNMGYR